MACTGPGPLGGVGELILVAEERGVGLGARYAGIDGPDPGPYMSVEKPAQAKVLAAGRPDDVRRHPEVVKAYLGEPEPSALSGEEVPA